MGETWVRSLGWEDPLEKGKAAHSIFWSRQFHGLYSPWGHKELDTPEQLSFLLAATKSQFNIIKIILNFTQLTLQANL